MEAEPRTLDTWRCICTHAADAHHHQSATCLALDPAGAVCWCTEFQACEAVPPLERVKIIRAEITALHEILSVAQSRGLLPEEEAAFWEVARAFAELREYWRELFGE